MSKLTFNSNDRPTLGIELELALVDGESMALTSAIESVLAALPDRGGTCFKPELMQCVIEINTGVCETIATRSTTCAASCRSLKRSPINSDCDCGGEGHIPSRCGANNR